MGNEMPVRDAQRELPIGQKVWFGKAVGVDEYRRIYQIRRRAGLVQARFLADEDGRWRSIDGLRPE